jgi:hypothetical protein
MLRATATRGRHEMPELNHTVFARGAPQSLQKLASATTTGAPHCAQKRARLIRESGMEAEQRVAQPKCITAAKQGLGHALAAHPSAVLAPQVAH